MKYVPVLLLLLVAACGSTKPAHEAQPEPAPAAETITPPALKSLKGEDVPWATVRGKDKRTLLVFSTLW